MSFPTTIADTVAAGVRPLQDRVRRIRSSHDAGFSLMETVISLTVLAVLSAAVGITLLDGLSVSKAGRERVAAANLASRELEIVRNRFSSSNAAALAVAAAGSVTNDNPLTGTGPSVVDGTAYTVNRDVQWMPTGNGVSACDGGSLVNHPSLKVTVNVIWPNMGSTRPVRSSTLLTPPKGLLGSSTIAFVAAKVQNASGLPASSVTVQATGPGGAFSQTTDSTGCAVFQVGAAGTYNVFMDMSGWVDQTGVQSSSKSAVVSAGQLARLSMTYDQAASMDITLATDAGYALPSPLPAVNYVKPNVPVASSRQILALGTPTTSVTGLWPTYDGYAAWSGSCPDSDPAAPPTSGSRGAPVVIAPGGTGSVVARLAPIDLTVSTAAGSPVVGSLVTAVSQTCAGTAPDRRLTLGTTDGAGQLKTSLPFGSWVLETTYLMLPVQSTPMAPAATGATPFTFEVD